eukprot:112228-Chlamydomonas_euryale.AAC.1
MWVVECVRTFGGAPRASSPGREAAAAAWDPDPAVAQHRVDASSEGSGSSMHHEVHATISLGYKLPVKYGMCGACWKAETLEKVAEHVQNEATAISLAAKHDEVQGEVTAVSLASRERPYHNCPVPRPLIHFPGSTPGSPCAPPTPPPFS